MPDIEPQSVAIIGGGLVGCLAALALTNLTTPYAVTVYDGRSDPRAEATGGPLRSINLAVSDRGIRALTAVSPELSKRVLADMIPMYGRMIHHAAAGAKGHEESQTYGLYGEGINSVDRGQLNNRLLDEMDAMGIEIRFGHKLTALETHARPTVFFNSLAKGEAVDFVLGCDGTFSATRRLLQRTLRMNFTQEYISKTYLELYIPPKPDGGFSLDPNHLHIWPRKDFMLIALPNPDGSFTLTFFADWSMTEALVTGDKAAETAVVDLFRTEFPDALELMGAQAVVLAFAANPRGALVCTSCSPYNLEGKVLLLGDAAHSMVPFYGQGLNCGWEDVRVLMELLEAHGSTERAFAVYSNTRHADLVAICQLAKDNYTEMASKVVDPMYLLRKRIDGLLARVFKGRWLPLYTMVSFRGDLMYSEVVAREQWQQRVLRAMVRGVGGVVLAGLVVGVRWWRSRG